MVHEKLTNSHSESTDAMHLLAKSIEQYRLLTPDEEKHLAARIKEGDKDARDVMVTSNLRLVYKIASKMCRNPDEFLDLFQEGNIGLMTAVERFDPDMGTRFATYATPWIESKIRFHIGRNTPIRIPATVQNELRALKNAMNEFEIMNMEPTDEDLAEACGMTVEKIKKLRQYQYSFTSTAALIGDDDDTSNRTLEDLLSRDGYDENPNMDELVIGDAISEAVRRLLHDVLTERERKAIAIRYGLGNFGVGATLLKTGEILGVSKQRARNIVQAALKKLREEGYGDPELLGLL